MPIHDWRRVAADAFYGFHARWIAHLTGPLNNGPLPDGYYAENEAVTADVPLSRTP